LNVLTRAVRDVGKKVKRAAVATIHGRERADELEFVNRWKAELDRAKKAKAKRQEVIDRCWRFWRGEHTTPSYRADEHEKGRPVRQRNYIRSTVEDGVALICDAKPGIVALPREENDLERAEKMTVLQDYCWDVEDMPVLYPIAVRSVLVGGIGAVYVTFDPDKNYPLGDPDVDVLDWKHVLPDPDGRDWFDLSDFSFIATEAWWPMWRLRREYGKAAEDISPEERQRRGESDVVPADTDKEVDGVASGAAEAGEGAWVYHIWALDEEAEGDAKRLIVIAGSRVLKDEPWEGDFPFVFYPGYVDPEEECRYPAGIVEDLLDAQRDMNIYASRVYEAMKYRPLTTFMYTSESGITKDMISNLEAAKLLVHDINQVKWYSPDPIPADVFKWFQETREDFHIMSGIREVMQGRDPEASSGVAIGRLQDMALARIRQILANMDRANQRLARLNDEIIKRHFTVTRQVRIAGDSPLVAPDPLTGRRPQWGFLDVNAQSDFFEAVAAEPQPLLDEAGQPILGEDGQPLMEAQVLQREARFDYIFEAGSTLAGARTQKRQESLLLFDRKALRMEDLLKDFGRANWQEIVAEMDELQQLRQWAQQVAPMLADYQGAIGALGGGQGQGAAGG